MTSAELNNFLNGKTSTQFFKTEIAGDLENYARGIRIRGGTTNLNFDDCEIIILKRPQFLRLLNATIDGELSIVDFTYLCNCIILAEELDFNDQSILEHIHNFSNYELNGFPTSAQIQKIIQEFKGSI